MWSFGSSVNCAWAQSGDHSIPQPISSLVVPGTLTKCGGGTSPTPPPPPTGAGASPTTPKVDRADRWPSLSFTTTRYSISEPLANALTSWNTRYGALSSVPSGCHVDVPTGRNANDACANLLAGIAARTSARPASTPPADGDMKDTAGALSLSAIDRFALYTCTLSGGTVTVT